MHKRMKAFVVALLCIAAALIAVNSNSKSVTTQSFALASEAIPIPSPDPCDTHPRPAREQQTLARRVFALHKWQDKTPVGPGRLKQMALLRGCADQRALKPMVNSWHDYKARFFRYRALRLIAPYPGAGTWWAIPYAIVSCEGGSGWTAANSSGAEGPYQLLGHGQPWPVTSWHDKMEHHRIAASLYASSGKGPWVASESCWGGSI
jgi:hypothetical protein